MRLEGSFYRVISSAAVEGGYDFELVLVKDHPIYEWHFPGQPVVSGMCTLTIVRECLASVLGKVVMFSSIKECKFLSALIPDKDLAVTLHLNLSGEDVSCVIESAGAPVFKVKAKYSFI